MDIVAYHERLSEDPITGDTGVLRDEWRVARIEDQPPERLVASFGPDWRRYSPEAEWVLEHRYIRRGTVEPWKAFQTASTRGQVLQYIDGHAVAIDAELLRLQQDHAAAMELARMKEEEDRQKRNVQEAKARCRQVSDAAFIRMRDGKTHDGYALAVAWNDCLQKIWSNPAFDRVAVLSAEPETEQYKLYTMHQAVLDAATVPVKRKAIREFLKVFGPEYLPKKGG